MGFPQLSSDACIYISELSDPFYKGVYVDDMTLENTTKFVKEELSSKTGVVFLGVVLEKHGAIIHLTIQLHILLFTI